MSRDVVELLRRLVACDTSNPPGREAPAAAVVEDYLAGTGVECERVAKDPERPNLVVRLRGRGTGPSLAFLGHLDVVQAVREEWSVDPFAGVEREGVIYGRGTVDMKSQVAATTAAVARLADERFTPAGDVLLLLVADEEVGSAGVGAPFLAEQRPDLRPDFVVGEGAGERYETPAGPIYTLDRGVKGSVTVTLTVHGEPADASIPGNGVDAAPELARLLARLAEHRPARHVLPEVEPLLGVHEEGASPALDMVVRALTTNVVAATAIELPKPANVVGSDATVNLQCAVLPGTEEEQLLAEIREALGEGRYDLSIDSFQPGTTSPLETPLHRALERFVERIEPEARLVPMLGYGYSDCQVMRDAYGSVAYGFIPFRSADPLENLTRKHGVDEHVHVDDLELQLAAALHTARTLGS